MSFRRVIEVVDLEEALCALKNVIWLDVHVFQSMLLLQVLIQFDQLACIVMQLREEEFLVFLLFLTYDSPILILVL